LKTNREAVPATAKIVLSFEATEEPEGFYTLPPTIPFVIKLFLYLIDQDQWKSLFAKEQASKVRLPFFLLGLFTDVPNSLLGQNLTMRRRLSAKAHTAALDLTKRANT